MKTLHFEIEAPFFFFSNRIINSVEVIRRDILEIVLRLVGIFTLRKTNR